MGKKRTKKRRKKMGRPPLPPGKARSKVIHLRVTPAEHKAVLADAKRRGLSVRELLMHSWHRAKGE